MNDVRTLSEQLAGTRLDPLEERIRNAQSPAEVAEICKANFAAAVTARRESDGYVSYEPVLQAQSVEPLPFNAAVEFPNGQRKLLSASDESGFRLLLTAALTAGAKVI